MTTFHHQPKLRLGSRDGFQEIIRHPWLAGFDWCGLIRRQLRPPCRPDTTFTRTDLTEEESRSAVAQLLSAPDICAEDQLLFKKYNHLAKKQVAIPNFLLPFHHPQLRIPESSREYQCDIVTATAGRTWVTTTSSLQHLW